MKHRIERFRFTALALGCLLLFWQQDASLGDWLFGLGILASLALWEGGVPGFDIAPPQPLLLLFLTITAAATTLAGGSTRFLAITVYLAVMALALASALKRDPGRIRRIELAIVVAACITAVTVFVGAMAWNLGLWSSLHVLAMDPWRGKGLLRDANVAGAFLACSYPLAAAYCIGLRKWRATILLLVSALLAAGVIFTFSRLALVLLALGVAAVIAVLVISRERRLLVAIGGCVLACAAAVSVAVAVGKFPVFRYEPIQEYDANGRFIAWVFGADMVREAPLGTGSGTFERRTAEYSEALVKRDRLIDDGTAVSDNLIRNGAIDGLQGWTFDPTVLSAEAVTDPTSVTGHAVRKRPTEQYRDVAQVVRIVPGRTYSLGAQVRSDGTPTLVIVHWYDEAGTLLAQTGTEPVTSTSWTETSLLAQQAPAEAIQVVVFLSNRVAGEQYFTAVRMVEGATLPSWSTSMQWGAAHAAPPGTISAHNTYIRVAVESGLPGLLVFATYLIVLLRRGWTLGVRAWQWPVAFALVLLAGFVIDTLHWRMLWIYAAVLAASFAEARVPQRALAPGPAPELTTQRGTMRGSST